MRRLCRVGVILLFALGCFPAILSAQDRGNSSSTGVRERGVRLGQNYPNPFNPTTRIPFELGEELFEGGEPVHVTIRIYNVLQQLVAIPKALNHELGNGLPVDGLEYTTPGRKEAYWDGTDRDGRQVASGVYLAQIVVRTSSGVLTDVRKMVVAK
ncbi:MAG TPA: hypothetical protein VIL13_06420 [Longimicrobiales bacterium]